MRPRPEIEKLAAVTHGGPDEAGFRKAGLNADEITDFSVCSNPYMPVPDMAEILKQVDVDRLPDSEATAFRETLAGKLGIPAENIIAGNGSMELIRMIGQAYFGPGDAVLILEPTFGEYELACRVAGAEIFLQKTEELNGFIHDTDKAVDFIRGRRPKGVFVCNPNNPTGRYLGRREIEKIAGASNETLLVIDEAYISFVEGSWQSLDLRERDNVIILRSMTKDFAIAGLRLGYAVANEDIIDVLKRVRPPWSVNAIAQQAGITVLKDYAKLNETRRKILKARDYLVKEFSALGFKVMPTETHFFLMQVKKPAAFKASLLKQGLLVRDCASFGLPEYIRIAARTMPECEKLINAVRETGLR